MVVHRDQRRADVRDVLDEFERWLLQERSAQECTAAAYTARVAAFVEWLPAPVEESLRKLTAAMLIEWVDLEAARGLKASTLGKQLVMLRSFLQYAHRSGRMGQDLSGVVPHAAPAVSPEQTVERDPNLVVMMARLDQQKQLDHAIDAFAAVCRPIIWLIGKNTNGIVRLLGFDPQQTESEVSDDELRVLVSSNTNLSKDERTILDDVFDASETIVAEVMRPRADVVFIEGDQPLAEAAAFVRDQPYSRYPVTGKDFDDVIGFVHVRDLLDVRDPNATTVADVTREDRKSVV